MMRRHDSASMRACSGSYTPHGMSQWASTMRVGRRMVRGEIIGLLSVRGRLWAGLADIVQQAACRGPSRAWSGPHHDAAVHAQHLAGDVGRLVGREVDG